jgi:transposase
MPIQSIGIDVSKKTLAVAFLSDARSYTLDEYENTKEGIDGLLLYLQTHGPRYAGPCVIESTGDFHFLSSFMLKEEGFEVNVINPLLSKLYQRASIRDAKSDSVDAKRLAFIGTQETNLPKFTLERKDIVARKALASLHTLERLRQELSTHLSRTEETMKTLGIAIDLSSAHQAKKSLDCQIRELEKLIMEKTSDAGKILSKNTPGLTERKIAVVETYLSGRSFENRDQLIAFCGLDVRARRSGNWKGKERLSKRGNPYLRKTLYHIGWGLSRYNEEYRKYYDELKARGLHYTTRLIAVARRFLRRLYREYYGSFPQGNFAKK